MEHFSPSKPILTFISAKAKSLLTATAVYSARLVISLIKTELVFPERANKVLLPEAKCLNKPIYVVLFQK